MFAEQKNDYVETLNRFHEKSTELRESELLKETDSIKLTMTFNESGLQSTIKQPEDTNLRAYLTIFRQFILKRELTNMDNIYELCQAHLKDDRLKGNLAKSQELWHNAFNRATSRMVYNGRILSPEEVTDLFLYGGMFHSDPDKERFLKALLPHEYNIFRWQFLELITRASKQIFYVDNVIVGGLKDGLFA
jgi:hypothetical protein